jgi:hypothetical protein
MNRHERRRAEARARKLDAPPRPGDLICPLYHVTVPENLPLIMRDGFKDHAASKGILIVTRRFEPGVWLADVPPITAISVDQFLCHHDEAWIEVLATEEFSERHIRGNEWHDPSWPTRQWCVPAQAVNRLVRREISLVEVLAMRLANNTTEHHRFYTAEVLRKQIATEMSGEVQARWNAALDAAVSKVSCSAERSC